MSLFGGKQTTKTTVKPSKQVDTILRDIVNRSNNIDTQFIERQFAQLTPQEQAAVQNYAQSGALRNVGGSLATRLGQGIEQLKQNNQALQNIATNPITAHQALDESKTLRSGTYSNVAKSAASAGDVTSRLGSATARSVARRGASQQAARSALDSKFTNAAISGLQNKTQADLDTASKQAAISGVNVGLGEQGLQLENQALQNQLNAGNFMQSYQNAMNTNNFQNANARALFPWEKLNNQLNVLNAVSPMAGYTTTGTQAAAPKGQQLAAAGMAGLSIYGKLGGFSGFDDKTQTGTLGSGANAIPVYSYDNQMYNNAGTGLFNNFGSWFGGGNKTGSVS